MREKLNKVWPWVPIIGILMVFYLDKIKDIETGISNRRVNSVSAILQGFYIIFILINYVLYELF